MKPVKRGRSRQRTRAKRPSFLNEPRTIADIRKTFSKIDGPHRTTLVRAVNRIAENPTAEKGVMNFLHPVERRIVKGILIKITGTRLREEDFL